MKICGQKFCHLLFGSEKLTTNKKECSLLFQYMSMEAEAGIFMGIECAVSGPDGEFLSRDIPYLSGYKTGVLSL